MTARFHKDFLKNLAKLPAKKKSAAIGTIDLFLDKPESSKLRLHKLSGEWSGYLSISDGGDLRLHFKLINNDTVAFFVAVGSHSQLYK